VLLLQSPPFLQPSNSAASEAATATNGAHGYAAGVLLMLILELCYLFYRCYWAIATATGAPAANTSASEAGTVAATTATGAATAASGAASDAVPKATPISISCTTTPGGSSFFCHCIITVGTKTTDDTALLTTTVLILYFYMCNVIVAGEVSHKRHTKHVYSYIIMECHP
jgi:hypothetical protein